MFWEWYDSDLDLRNEDNNLSINRRIKEKIDLKTFSSMRYAQNEAVLCHQFKIRDR